MLTPAAVRLNQNQILTSLLLGMGQGTMIAERLFPRLPQALSGVTLGKMGDERLRRYNLRRAPGAPTKRVDIKLEGKTYTVEQYSVEVPIPRELLREADETRRLNVSAFPAISQIAMSTAMDILALDYEIEVATLATTTGSYAAGNTLALAGGTKWSASTGTPVTDIRAASDVIRKKTGMRPNTLVLSADAKLALIGNPEVRAYLPANQMGPASLDQLKSILEVEEIIVGEAIWMNADNVGADVWGNNAILAYVPKIAQGANATVSLAQPGFGFTNVLEGHPFAETPYFEAGLKSWIYGGTFERQANVATDAAGFLFTNPK